MLPGSKSSVVLDHQGLHLRAALFRSIRTFFVNNDFLEVDTPIRQPSFIPESTIEPIEAENWFLQASPELCMKRLLAQGEERIFQLAPCFRKGEVGNNHLEEFTMLEWYRVDCDYNQLMQDCHDLIRNVVDDIAGNETFSRLCDQSGLLHLDLSSPWDKLTVADAFDTYCPITVDQALQEDQFDEMMVTYIEPQLGRERPHILYDYPAACGSLARLKAGDLAIAERFELYIEGLELANGFSELTNAEEQHHRFEEEIERIWKNSGRTCNIPERFLADLDGIRQAAGIALGVDRLLMLLLSKQSIHDVVSFGPRDW